MVNLIKLFPMLIYTIYAYCIPQIVDMNIPYNKQEQVARIYSSEKIHRHQTIERLITDIVRGRKSAGRVIYHN